MRTNRFVKPDGTEIVHNSPKQEGTSLYVTGAGDNVETGAIGAGTSFVLQNANGDALISVQGQFCDDIYLKDGYVMWQNAVIGDRLSLDIILPAEVPMHSENETGNAAENEDGVIDYITDSTTPDETWVGTHLLFPVDVVMNRFVNKLHLLGSNTTGLVIVSSDAAFVNKELVYKISVTSPTSNPDILVSVLMETYRERTV